MIFFADNSGTILNSLSSPVYQGSAEANDIYFIAPFANNLTVQVAFTLPNGVYTSPYVMTQKAQLNGVISGATQTTYSAWQFSVPNNITQYYGSVTVQFYVYSTTGAILATSSTKFTVGQGVPVQLPDAPTDDVYEQILSVLSSLNSNVENGSYAARAIYWWIDTYTYGANEITYYPVGNYGAFVKSLVTNNTGNQPYSDEGVLNSEYWAELVNFNTIYGYTQQAAASAQAAASSASSASTSAAQAAASATTAGQSATQAQEYAQQAQASINTVAQYAASAQQSANNSANSAAQAQEYAQQAQEYAQKNYTIVDSYDNLPRPGDSAYIYLVPTNSGTAGDGYRE